MILSKRNQTQKNIYCMTALYESLKEAKLAMVTKTVVDQWWSEGFMGRNVRNRLQRGRRELF